MRLSRLLDQPNKIWMVLPFLLQQDPKLAIEVEFALREHASLLLIALHTRKNTYPLFIDKQVDHLDYFPQLYHIIVLIIEQN